ARGGGQPGAAAQKRQSRGEALGLPDRAGHTANTIPRNDRHTSQHDQHTYQHTVMAGTEAGHEGMLAGASVITRAGITRGKHPGDGVWLVSSTSPSPSPPQAAERETNVSSCRNSSLPSPR